MFNFLWKINISDLAVQLSNSLYGLQIPAVNLVNEQVLTSNLRTISQMKKSSPSAL